MDLVDKIIAYESGEMLEHEVLEFFQDLVNTGMAWKLQGSYSRTATDLLQQGKINHTIVCANHQGQDEQ